MWKTELQSSWDWGWPPAQHTQRQPSAYCMSPALCQLYRTVSCGMGDDFTLLKVLVTLRLCQVTSRMLSNSPSTGLKSDRWPSRRTGRACKSASLPLRTSVLLLEKLQMLAKTRRVHSIHYSFKRQEQADGALRDSLSVNRYAIDEYKYESCQRHIIRSWSQHRLLEMPRKWTMRIFEKKWTPPFSRTWLATCLEMLAKVQWVVRAKCFLWECVDVKWKAADLLFSNVIGLWLRNINGR